MVEVYHLKHVMNMNSVYLLNHSWNFGSSVWVVVAASGVRWNAASGVNSRSRDGGTVNWMMVLVVNSQLIDSQ